MGLMLPTTRAPLMKTPIGSASSALSSRTLTHVHQATAITKWSRTETARRASGDATASSLISPWDYGIIASLVKQEQLRTPPAPSGVVKSSFWRFFAFERR